MCIRDRFFIVFVALLYLATGERVYVASGLVLLAAAGVFAFFAFDAVVAPRVLTWLNPWPCLLYTSRCV